MKKLDVEVVGWNVFNISRHASNRDLRRAACYTKHCPLHLSRDAKDKSFRSCHDLRESETIHTSTCHAMYSGGNGFGRS